MKGAEPTIFWYGEGIGSRLWAYLLLPLSFLFGCLTALRRLMFNTGLLRQRHFDVPVLVVGNITVGGTGKTPLVVALVERLQARGFRPGVVSRGYGGDAPRYPLKVTADTPATEAGDEPALIARRTSCPVMVDPDRSRAIRALLEEAGVDIVVSDDGLQHYRMGRAAEIAVIDGQRRLGNGFLLPSGPLRESAGRLRSVNLVVVNGGREDEAAMTLVQGDAINLVDGRRMSLGEFRAGPVHAVAGIGNPQRFFSQLGSAGLQLEVHPFPDHHVFTATDLHFDDDLPVLMTEKDAVKCRSFADSRHWYVPVEAQFNQRAETGLTGLLTRLDAARKGNG